MTAPRYVSVIGASHAAPELAAKSEELGELLAERGCLVVFGGGSGVMEAVARGVKKKGGAWGTLSEIGLARGLDRPVILLGTWEVTPPDGGEPDGVRRAQTPAEAVELALA